MSEQPFFPEGSDAIAIAEDMAFAALGVRGLGRWFATRIQDGYTPEMLVSMVRYGTDSSDEGQAVYQEYLRVFPMMDQFLKDKVFVGPNPEMQYLDYRNTVQDAASRYGINASLVEPDKVAQYISQRNSAAEIVNRMGMAAEAVASTPPATVSILKNYYNLNTGDLISFYLDPDQTEDMLKKQYTAARIGTEALRQQFVIGKQQAEQLAERGVNAAEAQQIFESAASQRALMAGAGETVTQQELIGAAAGSAKEQKKVERVARSRQGRFQGGGEYLTQAGGVAGLGESTTR